MRQIITLLLVLASVTALPARALDIVATSPSMGALVRAVADDRATLTVLAGPNRDLHALQVKPSMILALRGADLVVAIGAELEIGWLPPAIASAANPAILPGSAGYFEAAAQVPLLDAGGPADRALGDVHPGGNPHVNMDPVRMADIAVALAERLALLDPAGAPDYRRNADVFAAQVAERLPLWQDRLENAPGVVLHHRDAVYLLTRFGVPLLGTIEPTPGVPPTARQIAALAAALQGRRGVIVYAPYQSPKPARQLALRLDWPSRQLTLEPPMDADGAGYLHHIELWVDTIAEAR
ncbi:zinc ABC transporter substrate-binding protein [Thiohalocapsa marina]|uniref:Zinc ABC transporter substrate-binding protein n=1 Tax=Thiohalocapsa marina TaxID=424902 RepID=A0A5M8FDM8_9GAMM|nr:metal ABC transporter substrate-binding protein [Thiohalocapsa marina]KAA6182978.1 zinc ABC transporter substrate-binding protein [Thiohalocapsa marina]